MPSFDIVSEVDLHEITNAVDQANREIGNRFDFKGSDARIVQKDALLTLQAEAEFQIKQILDILHLKIAKRGIDVAALSAGEITTSGKRVSLEVTIRQGIDTDTSRNFIKEIKGLKLKVQAAIQGEKVRVSAKKRDDLQAVIEHFRESSPGLPLQYINFRD